MPPAGMEDTGKAESLTVRGGRIGFRVWGEGLENLVCLHGFPTSSFLWRAIAPRLATTRRVIAPDLPGFGDSELGGRSGTWEEMVTFVEDFACALGLEKLDLMVHDWGGLIGLRWACDQPERLGRLIITNTGFFPDGKWHDMAKTMRQLGAGEELLESITPELMTATLRAISPMLPDRALAEYWKCLATPERRRAKLALYRSGDFSKLRAYEGKLAALGRPTLVLWGGADRFAPPAGARRFSREIPGAELHILDGVNHFLQEDAPEEVGSLVTAFLESRNPPPP